MNKIQSRLRLLTAVFAGAAMLLLSGAGMADPPARVARLSFFSGPVSFSPAGEDEWALATPNRPLITGDPDPWFECRCGRQASPEVALGVGRLRRHGDLHLGVQVAGRAGGVGQTAAPQPQAPPRR